MTSLADLPEIIGFFSYSREDDEDSQGALSALRDRIQRELRGQLGRSMKTFRLWQDKEAIAAGKLWEDEIKSAVGQAVFFIPIITPTVIKSPYCKFELDSFLTREAELERNDLVFPILYITVPELEDGAKQKSDPVLSIIARRQYLDWREFRHRDVHSPDVLAAVERFCATIRDSLRRSWLSPQERQNRDKAAAIEHAETERKRHEAESRRREEEVRQAAVAAQALEREEKERLGREAQAARERAEQERLQREAEAKRRAESEAHARPRPIAPLWAWLSSTRLAVIGLLVAVALGVALSPKSPTPIAMPSGQLVPATAPPAQFHAPTPVQSAPGAVPQPLIVDWMGIRVQTVTTDIADSLGISPLRGAIVPGVNSGGPVKLGGVEINDVIVRFDGLDIKDIRDLPRFIPATPAGITVEVAVIRKGKELSFQAKVGRSDASDNGPMPSNYNSSNNAAPAQKLVVQKVLGFELSGLSDDLRDKFNIRSGVKAVVVTAVDPDVVSTDPSNRLAPGDLITEVQYEAVFSPVAVQAQIEQLKAQGKKVAILLVVPDRSRGTQFIGPRFIALSLEPPTNGKK